MRASPINGCALLLARALPRRPREGRNRGAALPARRLARVTALHQSRARSARLDRGSDISIAKTTPRMMCTKNCAGQFSEEVVKPTVAIAAIKAWNRIAISFRAVHRVRKPHAA
jgi:hypothetical protein